MPRTQNYGQNPVPFTEYESRWIEIEKYLSPKYLKEPILRKFAPDFGLALARLGFAENAQISLLPAKLNLFGRVDDDTMTATSNIILAGTPYCMSLDFDKNILPEILSCLPNQLKDAFTDALRRAPFLAAAELAIELDVESRLGPETMGASENFRPLVIERIMAARFNPLPLLEAAEDIPSHVFRLRKAYVLRSPAKGT